MPEPRTIPLAINICIASCGRPRLPVEPPDTSVS